MSENEASEEAREYASPACFMHELDPAYREPSGPSEVAAWRKAERERLIAARLDVDALKRAEYSNRIAERLWEAIGDPEGLVVSLYWPFRGEPDLRPFLEKAPALGARTALPVVVAKRAPLVFRLWAKGEPLERGVWNIPVPAEGAEVLPDIVIAPVVGFDPAGYRLGYGGGFFDRTLAAAPRRPRVIAVGYGMAAIPTIHPQAHDIPMDLIVTESRIITPVR